MSFETCAATVKKWFDENSEVKMPDKVVDQMARLLDASGKDALTPAQFQAKMQAAVEEYGDRLAAKERATKAMDVVIRERGVQNTVANAKSFIDAGMDRLKAPVEAFMSRIQGGSLRPGQGTNLSVLKMAQGLETDFLQFFRRALGENENALQMADKTSKLTQDIYQEKAALEAKTQLGLSNNPLALEIAKAMKGAQNRVLQEAQSVTPFLEPAQSFIASRNHNRELVVGDGSTDAKARFVADAISTFGDKSFLGNSPAEKTKLFEGMYERIRAGSYGAPGEESNFWGVPGTGGDLARKMAPARSLVAKDWKSEFEYAAKYGDNLWTAMGNQIRASSDQISKISKWGSRMADNYQSEFSATLKALDPDQQEVFRQNKDQFEQAFRVSMGSQYAPANNIWSRIAQGLQTWQTVAKAGMHLPRSFNDFQNAVTLSRDLFGKNLIQNSAEMAAGVAKAFTRFDDAKERLGDMGVFFNATHRDFIRSISNSEAGPGKVASLAEMIGKISLADRQQASIKYGMASVIAKQFGDLSSKDFGELPSVTQQGLARYNIGPNEWGLMKQASETVPFLESETRGMMTPEAIRNLDNDTTEKYLRDSGQWSKDTAPSRQLLDRAKYQTALNYSALLNEHTSMAAANTDLRQRNFMYGNTTQNSAMGLMRRMMWQFKQAALVNSDIVRRTYYTGDGSKSNVAGLAQHLVMGALYYTMGDYMIQYATGKSPQDPTSPEMLGKAVIGSGGGGIWADGLIRAMQGQTKNDMISGLSESVAGPGLSTLAETALATGAAAKGAVQQAQGNDRASLQGRWFARLIQANSPGQNVFYLKSGMNYFLMNELHDFMGGGGYLEALRKQTDKDGQEYSGPFAYGGQNFWEK